MKNRISILLALVTVFNATAQKNRIEIGVGGYKFLNVIYQLDDPVNIFSLQYSREISKKTELYFQYSRVPVNGWLLAEINPSMAKESVGKLTSHNKYNYLDIGGKYRMLQFGDHAFYGYGAISLAIGEDQYLTRVIWTEPEPGEPYGHPIEADYDRKTGTYVGGILGLEYNYTFWKNKMNLSPTICARYYTNGFPFQINYGIKLGYSFNLIKMLSE